MHLTKLSTHLASNPDKFTTDGTATTTATLNTLPYTEFMFLEEHGFARLDNSIQGEKGKWWDHNLIYISSKAWMTLQVDSQQKISLQGI